MQTAWAARANYVFHQHVITEGIFIPSFFP